MNWGQLRTILWLRWRLSRNQMERAGAFNAMVTMVFLAAGLMASLAGLMGGVAGGLLSLSKQPPWIALLIWDIIVGGFLFFWAMSLLVELQRSETIDFSRLMHLPVSLRQIFFLNYLASHFTPALILTVPGMLGLALGMVLGAGAHMLLLFPLVLGFIFMITAWTYCLRGWLVSLMVNKRRRRAIVVGLTMAVILVAQTPNIYLNVIRVPSSSRSESVQTQNPDGAGARARARPEQALLTPAVQTAHRWVPVLWVPNGAMGLAQGILWPALYGAAGSFLLGGLGLMRAYRGTLRFYLGNHRIKAPKTIPREPNLKNARGTSLLERTLPWLPPQTGVMTLTFLRSLLRAPEVKMALIMPFVMLVIFGSLMLRKSESQSSPVHLFVPAGLTFFMLLGLIQLAANHFGLDRTGFRSLVLLPVRRGQILLAKNLSLLTVGLTMETVILVVLWGVLRLPAEALATGFFQFLSGYLLLSLVGNWISILTPYRIAPGSLKPTKTGSKIALIMFALHLLFPLAMLPVLVPSALQAMQQTLGFGKGLPLGLISSVVLLGLVTAVYALVLTQQGRLLQRREQRILDIVTREVE